MQSTDFMNTVIRKVLEEKMDNGYKRFLIFPYGEVGMKIKEIGRASCRERV